MIQSSLSQQDLLFFVTLCRLQSLTVSAQKLNLSLSSACRMLTHLRETFGEPLFVRSRSGLMPTPGAMTLRRIGGATGRWSTWTEDPELN